MFQKPSNMVMSDSRAGALLVRRVADPNAPGLIPFLPGFPSGAAHSGELPFLFDLTIAAPLDLATGKRIPLTKQQEVIASTMIRYWTQFARNGNPNSKEAPHWPRFDTNNKAPLVQVFASGSKGVKPSSNAAVMHQCAFWETFLD
ncbi:MAG TPA: carboxylesterase family protein [Abditibacteriaceae bacterium]|jgi:para-nitrobenzyl esterase|nr:carboxylesterase family protein [Abditibacteriaceae bacterium]